MTLIIGLVILEGLPLKFGKQNHNVLDLIFHELKNISLSFLFDLSSFKCHVGLIPLRKII
jgi:hypothetical protein